MKNIRTTTIDEMSRVLIPGDMRCRLGINKNDNFTITPCIDGISVVLTRATVPCFNQTRMDALGRLTFPPELREKIGWTCVSMLDTLAVSINVWDQTLTLRLFEKYEEKCVFCQRPEAALRVNRMDVCKHCAGAIAAKIQNSQIS